MNDSRGTLIVTGAGRGIGAAVARLAGAEGFAVAVNYAANERAAGAVVADILEAGGRALAVRADVSREDEIAHLFEVAIRELGPLAALVNNAGITGGMTRLEGLSAQVLEDVLRLNVTGTILCAREAVRCMSTARGGSGGSIVNISSRAAGLGSPGEYVHYAASKGAVDSFTLGLAREVASEGIRVNAISPGLIETEIHAASGEPGRIARIAPTIPMRRAGTAEEVAAAVLWLLSPGASYTTGTIVHVSGGR